MNSLAAACDRARNLVFLGNPSLWPAWPFLPLVRRKTGVEECGLLFDLLHLTGRTGYSATVFLCNLFCIPGSEEEFLALPRETYDQLEDVYNAGWRID